MQAHTNRCCKPACSGRTSLNADRELPKDDLRVCWGIESDLVSAVFTKGDLLSRTGASAATLLRISSEKAVAPKWQACLGEPARGCCRC
jgi:hypothetical protein